MLKHEIETWARSGRSYVTATNGWGTDWWPQPSADNQARASAWALAFFIEAALDRCAGKTLTAACSADAKKQFNQNVIQQKWANGTTRLHEQSQVLLDFTVHNWDAASPIQLTGESEVYAQHGVGDSLGPSDDYSWDFYKLLVVPSTSRLFFARCAGTGGVSAEDRCDALAETLVRLVDWYGPTMLRPHDELGAVLIPASKTQRDRTVVLWLDRGRLRYENVTPGLLG